MTLLKNRLKTYLTKDILLIFLVPFIVTLIWFKDGGIIGGAEEGLSFYNPSNTLNISSNLWLPGELGIISITDITKKPFFELYDLGSLVGIPTSILNATAVFLFMFLGCLGVYLLVKNTLEKELKLKRLALLSAIFYLLNPFSMSQVWGRGLSFQYMGFAYIPIFTYLVVKMIEDKKIIYGLSALLISFVLSGVFGHPSYIITTWIPSGVYLAYFLCRSEDKFKGKILSVFLFFILLIGWVIVHSWWLIPNLLISKDLYFSDQYFNNQAGNDLEDLRAVSNSGPIQTVLRLMHNGYFIWTKTYGTFYLNPLIQLFSWLVPLFLAVGLFFAKRKRIVIYYVSLLLIGLFVSLGSNIPMGILFEKLFSTFSIFKIFRNPYEKFGLIYLLAFIPLMSLGVLVVTDRFNSLLKKKIVLLSIVFLLGGFFVWPIWTGEVISWGKGLMVPQYYQQANQYINNQDKSSRIFFVPFVEGWGGGYKWQPIDYHGADPQRSIFNNPVISTNANLEVFDYLRESIGTVDIAPVLSLLGTRYVIVRHDLITNPPYDNQSSLVIHNYYQPNPFNDKSLVTICSNLNTQEDAINCSLSDEQSDLSQVKYLHLLLQADKETTIIVGITDVNGSRRLWSYPKNTNYQVNKTLTEAIINLSNPSEAPAKFNSKKIKFIQVFSHNGTKLFLQTLKLDSGDMKKIDSYKYLSTFGALDMYESKSPPATEIRSVSSILLLPQVLDMFEDIQKDPGNISAKAYLIKSQNLNLRPPEATQSSSQITSYDKISNSRFFFQSSGNDQLLFVLNKTYSKGWKILKLTNKEKLDNTLLNNIKLLTTSFVSEDKQYKVNGFANLWLLESSGNYGVIFYHQVLIDTLWMIVVPIIALIAFFVSLQFIYGRKK